MWGFISRTALSHQQQIVNIFDNSQQFAKSISLLKKKTRLNKLELENIIPLFR